MNKMKRDNKYREGDMKALLIEFLMSRKDFSSESVIINELTVDKYSRRADLVLINKNELHVYEIKSDTDSLVRLDGQVSKYLDFFDKVTIVVTSKHTKNALSMLPSQVEVIEICADRFKIIRRGKKSINKRKESFISMMTRVELKNLASKNNLATGAYNRKYLEELMKKIPVIDLRNHAISCLKRKYADQFIEFTGATSNRAVTSSDISLLSIHKNTSTEKKEKTKIIDIINGLDLH
jgi:hypothetical protein